jgi:hypothetical protein
VLKIMVTEMKTKKMWDVDEVMSGLKLELASMTSGPIAGITYPARDSLSSPWPTAAQQHTAKGKSIPGATLILSPLQHR